MAEEKAPKILNVDLLSGDELRVSYSNNSTAVYTVEQLESLHPKDVEMPDPE